MEINTKLQNIYQTYFEIGNTTTIFGIPVSDLNREELISCIGYLNQKIETQRNDHAENLQTLTSLRQKR